MFRVLVVATVEKLSPLLDEMVLLRAEVVNLLERRIKAQK